MSVTTLDPTQGHVVPGVAINEHQFVAAVPGAQLFQIVVDPRHTEDRKLTAEDPSLAAVRDIRADAIGQFEAFFVSPKCEYFKRFPDRLSQAEKGAV